MSPGAKVFLTLAGVGTVLGVVLIAGAKNANAAPAKPKPQVPGSNAPPDIVVPPILPPLPPAQQQQPPAQPLPSQPLPPLPSLPNIPLPPVMQQPPSQPLPSQPLPSLPLPPVVQQPSPPNQQQQVPPGVTFSIPNPLGGGPLGTFDPATGNVFGPGGLIIGTFDPTTGIFTASTGQQLKIPNFPPGTPGGVVQQPAAQQPAAQQPATPPPAPPPPPAVQPPPAQQTTSPVSTVAADTAAMVATLLEAETRSGWNATDPNVGVFQKARGLTVDSKFGPGTALKAALEIGTLPLVRFWPLGSTKAKLLSSYKQSLLELANQSSDPVRAQQLRLSAQREDARAFSTKGPLPALPSAMQVALAKVA